MSYSRGEFVIGAARVGRLAILGAAFLAACAVDPGAEDSAAQESSRPSTELIRPIHLHDVSLPSADAMLESSTVVAAARLVEIRSTGQRTHDGTDVRTGGNEIVELVFEPEEAVKGVPETISIAWAGYVVDGEGVRQARLSLNGVTFGDEDIGSSYLILARPDDQGRLVLNSLDGVFRIREDRSLEPLVEGPRHGDGGADLRSAERPSAELVGRSIQDLRKRVESLETAR
jgi:hypothetical protein